MVYISYERIKKTLNILEVLSVILSDSYPKWFSAI